MADLVLWEPARLSDTWGVCIEGTRDLKPKWIIHPQPTLTTRDVALICAAHNAQVKAGSTRSIDVTSLVNSKLEPVVQITLGTESCQLGVRDARHHVTALQECIEASLSDALLVRFIKDSVFKGGPGYEQAMGGLLQEFRKFRESFEAPVESDSEQ